MKLPLLLAAVSAAACLHAKTVYVDCKLGDYTGHDGSTPELALETLMEGCEKAVSGDTVEVASGVYNKGQGNTGHWWGAARVRLWNKNIRFYAPEGAEATIIEGGYGDDSGDGTGFGEGGLRCIILEGNTPAVFENFTIRKGRIKPDASNDHPSLIGGAVMASNNGTIDWTTHLYLVGCIIEDCDSRESGVAWGGTFVRCLFRGNDVKGSYFARHANFVNCVFSGNGESGDTAIFQDCDFVNDTFADNGLRFTVNADCRMYNNLVGYGQMTVNASEKSGNLVDSPAVQAFLSPGVCGSEWRAGAAAAVGCGDAAYLGEDYIAFDSGIGIDRYVDFKGAKIPEAGTIAAGAVQKGSDVAVSGAIEIGSDGFLYNGRPCIKGSYVATTNWPEMLTFTYATNGGVRVVNYVLAYGNTTYNRMSPMIGGDDPIKLLPPRKPADGVLKLSVGTKTTQVVWADPKADAETADGTEANPYPTLQAAIDSLTSDGAVIIAKAGTYEPGPDNEGVTPFKWGASTNNVMVYSYKHSTIRIVGESGAANTFIKGRPDPETGGFGTNAVSAVATQGTHILQGFTVTGCYGSSGTLNDPWYSADRAVLYTYTDSMDVVDCVIEGNVSAGCVCCGRMFRTVIRDNDAFLGVIGDGSKAAACVISGNRVSRFKYGRLVGGDGLGVYANIYSCSFADNTTDSGYAYYPSEKTFAVNTVMVSDDCNGTLEEIAGHYGCVYHGFESWCEGDYLKADPLFTDPAAGDLRLLKTSPALGAGVPPDSENAKDWLVYAPWDVNGDMVGIDAAGNVTPGAYSSPFDGVVVLAEHGGIEVENGRIGVNVPGAEVTVAAAAGPRPVAGVVVDGVTNLFESLPGHRLTVSGDEYVEALYLNRWYASTNGSDSALGYYPSCAKTLQGALSAAVAGDTVVACKGVYDTGTMIQPDTDKYTYTIRSRAVVPSGVALVSECGRDETVIEGAAAVNGIEDGEHGIGTDAVRGVYLASGASLEGFTVRYGHTRKTIGTSGTSEHSGAETTGGGVHGVDRTSCTVRNCILSDCAAYRGGNAFRCTLDGCITERGYATYLGGGLSDGNACNTLSRGNEHDGQGHIGTGLGFSYRIENCTALDSVSFNGASGYMNNTVARKQVYVSSVPGTHFTNCVFRKGLVYGKSETFDSEADRVKEIADADFLMNSDGTITTESTNLVDRADTSLDSGWSNDRDAFGAQRVYNGVRDIGACEADWRGVYGDVLNPGKVEVSSASPAVTKAAGAPATLRLVDGTEVDAEISVAAKTVYHVPVYVEGGALTVTVDGVSSVYTADAVIKLEIGDVGADVSFVFEGDGSADIGGFSAVPGFMIFVR